MTETEWVQHLNRCARSHCADLSAAQFAELAALVSSLALARDEANMESLRNTHARIVAEQERDEARSMGAALTNRHAELVAEREKLLAKIESMKGNSPVHHMCLGTVDGCTETLESLLAAEQPHGFFCAPCHLDSMARCGDPKAVEAEAESERLRSALMRLFSVYGVLQSRRDDGVDWDSLPGSADAGKAWAEAMKAVGR